MVGWLIDTAPHVEICIALGRGNRTWESGGGE